MLSTKVFLYFSILEEEELAQQAAARIPIDLDAERIARKKVNRSGLFWEVQCQEMSPVIFKKHFRMLPTTLNYIVDALRPFVQQDVLHRGQPIDISKVCAVAIWRLATGDCYRTISVIFSIGKSTAWACTSSFCILVERHLFKTWVRFPENMQEWNIVKTRFGNGRAGFSDCVGALDGTQIPIHGPSNDRFNTYINRKGWPSINTLAVCDANKMFMYLYAKWPGSANDKRVFKNSILGRSNGSFCPPGSFLLGDAGFTLCNYVLTPYIGRGRLGEVETNFNHKHSQSRMVIEHAFGELKARWRACLVNCYAEPNLACKMIASSATLHNICRYFNDRFWPKWIVTDEELEGLNRAQPIGRNDGYSQHLDRSLINWRNRIAQRMWEG